jgi:hypothetical protein
MTGNNTVHEQMRIVLVFLLSAILVRPGRANFPVEVENATSPDGKFILKWWARAAVGRATGFAKFRRFPIAPVTRISLLK